MYLRTLTTPLWPCCQSSPRCSTTSHSTSLETTSYVSSLLLSPQSGVKCQNVFTSFQHLETLENEQSPFFCLVDDLQMSCYRIMCSIYSLGTVKTPHAERSGLFLSLIYFSQFKYKLKTEAAVRQCVFSVDSFCLISDTGQLWESV